MYFFNVINLIIIKFYKIEDDNVNVNVFNSFFNISEFDKFSDADNAVSNADDDNNLIVKKIN